MGSPTNWTPTANMQKALGLAQGWDWDFTVTMLCKETGINRVSYYDWMDNPRFRTWWADAQDRYFMLQRNKVVDAMIKQATGERDKGNTAAQKLYLELYVDKYAPRSRQDVQANVAVVKTYMNVRVDEVTGVATEVGDGDK